MQFKTAAIVSFLGLASVSVAAPTSQDSGCSLYPWFIAPYENTRGCTGSPAYFQPTSGPYNPKPVPSGCRPLYDPSGNPMSFESVSINREACPQQKWTIKLYTDGKCGSAPTVVNTNTCVSASGTWGSGKFVSFEAIPVKGY